MKPKDYDKIANRRKEKLLFAFKLGQHLKKLREKNGMSQEELSTRAGYFHTYVNKIENGKYSPSMHTIWRLAYSLELSLDNFFDGF